MKDVIKAFSSSKTFAKGYVRISEFDKTLRKLYAKAGTKDVEILTAYWDKDKEGILIPH